MAQKILIVDDDPVIVRLVEGILIANWYAVESAIDGLDALAKMKKIDPDLVVLDVMMPEINGYDVCYQLRFNKDFKKIPIVLLTYRKQELDSKIGDRTNIAYVPKPLDSGLLLREIANLLPK